MDEHYDARLRSVETDVAVVKADVLNISTDVHEIKQKMDANTGRAIANLWATIIGAAGVMATILSGRLH